MFWDKKPTIQRKMPTFRVNDVTSLIYTLKNMPKF